MLVISEDTEIEGEFDFEEDDDEEESKPVSTFERKEKRVFASELLDKLVDRVLGVDKDIVVILPNAAVAREFLGYIRAKKSKITVKTPLSIDNIHVVFKITQVPKLFNPLVVVHSDTDFGLITEVGKEVKLTSLEIEIISDHLIQRDSNRELCRKCKEKNPDALPYGKETGEVESVPQYKDNGLPAFDSEGNQLYLDFPEMICEKGHRWYKGEGARRDIKGPNPVLLASHLYGRKRREINVASGTPDPSFARDRFGKPVQGKLIYNRSHPDGRKINTPEQRKANGASYYRIISPLSLLFFSNGKVMLGILSIGTSWLLGQLSKKQNMQNI